MIMSEVMIYTKTGCPYCAAAMDDFRKRDISFTEINVSKNPEVISKVLKLTGGERIVPVIIDGDKVKIGFGGG